MSLSLSLLLSMSAFALVASISPGPVNLACLASGTRHGLRASLGLVLGATCGFLLLLVAAGLGLGAVLAAWPAMAWGLRAGGMVFLLCLGWQLAMASGGLASPSTERAPGVLAGAAMQALNPKAWLVAVAGVGAYTRADPQALAVFCALYAPICGASLLSWVAAGAFVRRQALSPARMQQVQRALAALLVASGLLLFIE